MRYSFLLLCLSQIGLFPVESVCQHRVIHSEIDGVPLVRTEGGPKYSGPLIELESDLILGVDEGEPEWQLFYRTPRILVAPDGTIILVDIQRFEIFFVSDEGELLARQGGSGAGPGEFRDILDAFWADVGQEIWLTDQLNARITRYNLGGDLLGSFSYGGIRSRYQHYSSLGNGSFLATGTIYKGPDLINRVLEFAIVNQDLERTVLLHEYQNPGRFMVSENRVDSAPYHLSDSARAFPDGRILLSQPQTPRLTVYSNQGEIQFHIERDWEEQPVTGEEKRRIRNMWRSAGLSEAASRIPFPDRKPFFSSAFTDSEGRIWLQRYVAPEDRVDDEGQITFTSEYEIYSREGVWLGTQPLDHIPRVITGEYVYCSYLSEEGPRFERLRIIPKVPELKPEGI
ncbi:hypothetical protein ACFL41_00990 [Gemmatimonadota bacterium]